MNRKSPGLLVALSAGGINAELASQGLGVEHVEELLVRIAIRLLRGGHRLAFGGTLGNPQQLLTDQFIETAQSWLDGEATGEPDVIVPSTWPLVNYSAWPAYKNIASERRACLVGICQIVDIDVADLPADLRDRTLQDLKDNPQVRRYFADALTQMRMRSAQDAGLRIVWAGRIKGAAGWMPGILEEVMFTLEQQKPILILGGVGGCAHLLAQYLHDRNASWPEQLNPAGSADAGRDALISSKELAAQHKRFRHVQQLMSDFRGRLHSKKTVNGLDSALVKGALLAESTRTIVRMATTAATQCLAGTTPRA